MAAPKGNQYGAKESKWLSALERALVRNDGSLNRVAEKLIQMAEEGEQWAVLELGNRLDGKPKQVIDATIEQTNYNVDVGHADSLRDAIRKARPDLPAPPTTH